MMLREITFGLCLFATGLLCLPSRAQLTATGVGGGFGIPGGGAYAGPGNIVGSAYAYWGLRCYTTAYTGNVADIYAPSDASHTLLTCSSGGVINETVQALATTCATSCSLKTLYDQSAANSCGGPSQPCDFVQATEATRPTIVTNCLGGRPCFACSGTQEMPTAVGYLSGQSQPNTVSYVGKRTGNFASTTNIWGNYDFSVQIGGVGANTIAAYAGSVLSASGADNVFHAVQNILNGASSTLYIDGTATNGSIGSNSFNPGPRLCSAGGNFYTGQGTEVGAWNVAFSGAQQSNMNANQRSWWSF
jgi:hypothetical protein